MFCRALDEGWPFAAAIVMLAVWLVPPFSEPLSSPVMVLTPVLIALFVALAIAGMRPRPDAGVVLPAIGAR